MAKLSLDDFDHPIVFMFFLILVLIPVLAFMAWGGNKLGLTGFVALLPKTGA